MSSTSNYLCEELLDEIFLRLPLKSVLRFRSLSKSICARIDSSGFIRLYALQSPKKLMIIHGFSDKTMYTMHSEDQPLSYAGITPVEYPFAGLTIVGSCNGIVCLHDYVKDIIHLWNPSINRHVTLHDLRPPKRTHRCYEFTHGFGYDPIIDDYKIVRFARAGGTFVYNMKTDTWQEVASHNRPFKNVLHTSQCLLNGALHCVSRGYSNHDSSNYILRFDLSSELFSTIELPPEPGYKNHAVTIIKGCLAVIGYQDPGRSRIWVRDTSAAYSWLSVAFKDYKIYANGDILSSLDKLEEMVYNPETEARSRVEDLRAPGSLYSNYMIRCSENLGVLNMGISCDVIEESKKYKRK